MNAVNLIPADARKRRVTPSTSRPTMALIAGLVVVLMAVVVYVTAVNKVSSRQHELAQVTTANQRWKVVASSYQQYMQTAQQRAQELSDVRQLVVGRYQWESLLSQMSRLLPTDAQLSSLQATTAAAAGTAPTSGISTSGSSTASTPSPAGSANASAPIPAVQLSGCATSQDAVAQTMVALHKIQGVSAVTLSSSTESSAGGSGSGSSGSGSSAAGGQSGSAGCALPVQFQLSLTFTALPAPSAPATGGASSSGGAPKTAVQTSSRGTATAAASTNSTGVAQ